MEDEQGIAAAWVAAWAELDAIEKRQTADTGTYKYSYASLGDVLGSVRPVLARHGLAIMQDVESVQLERGWAVTVVTRLVHVSGAAWLSPSLLLPAGQGPQAIGSAITYGCRYSLVAFLGIGIGGDDDGQAAQAAPAPAPVVKKRPSREATRLRQAFERAGVPKEDRPGWLQRQLGRPIDQFDDIRSAELEVLHAKLLAVSELDAIDEADARSFDTDVNASEPV